VIENVETPVTDAELVATIEVAAVVVLKEVPVWSIEEMVGVR
jgi:hypothetical protein